MLVTEPAVLDEIWDRTKPKLVEALKHAGGTHDIDDVHAALVKGEMQIWLNNGSVIVTQVIPYPRFTAVNQFLIGGDLRDAREIEVEIVEWAKKSGYGRVQLGGRKGWGLAWPEYRNLGAFFVKDI